MNDSKLDELIRASHPQPEFPPSFQREIWTRIATTGSASWRDRWARWSESLLAGLARPIPAFAIVALMLLAGLSLGQVLPREKEFGSSLSSYLLSINPLHDTHGGASASAR